MELEGTYTFDAPRDVVWDALMTPEILANIIPGCQRLEQTGENEFKANLMIKVGPVQGDFQGAVQLTEINPPQSYVMHLEGRGQAGFLKGTGNVRLEDQGDSTLMRYDGEAQVGGRMAGIGQRLMDSTAKAMTKQGLDGLHRQIKGRTKVPTGAPTNGKPTTTTTVVQPDTSQAAGPSQMEFAAGVAKNMVDDLLSPERQRLVLGGGVGVVVIIFLLNWWMNIVARKAAREVLRRYDY